METMLEARNLAKHYEDFSLRGVSLEVRPGSITGLFGANGAGKSTVVKVLAHQAPPHAGSVRVFGLSYADEERAIKNRIGYVPQDPVFYTDIFAASVTVRWMARFVAPYFARWDGALFHALLDEFKVNPLKKIRHLSGGQKKLLAIAMALSHGAELLILDEPAAGLDVVYRRALLDRLRAFVADGSRAVVVASHVTDGLDEIADEVLFLDEGQVVLRENRDDLLSRWKWIHFKAGALDSDIERGLTEVRRQPFGNRGLTSDFRALCGRLAAAVAAGDVKVENASLEDVLASYIRKV